MTTPELYPESPAGTLRTLTSPRAGLLQHPPSKAQINPGLSLSLDEKWGSRQSVCGEGKLVSEDGIP